ncbi:uncharacterized protein BJ171DRAFT_460954 [Polychytrium aggregatum]|uniref:uncharacterized protein n=1 Tax=Polychytrium aggregatum TaxID=110093 RepID=UPI0022FDE32E|nr:uncharacterized protein BJ171DRAFT_460954 [Polychytrium aggregatum]KAI9202854.1 hypothetical protein BJ171DRAFT_460954 [Polychytrium aggregatum]
MMKALLQQGSAAIRRIRAAPPHMQMPACSSSGPKILAPLSGGQLQRWSQPVVGLTPAWLSRRYNAAFSIKELYDNIDRRNTKAKKKAGVRDIISEEAYVPAAPGFTSPTPQLHKANAFCTAENYHFSNLLPILQKKYILHPYIADDVYHIQLPEPGVSPGSSEGAPRQPSAAEAFIFNSGTVVTWGATEAQNEALLEDLKAVEVNRYKSPETEWFDYLHDPSVAGGLVSDTIVLGSRLPTHQAMLAYSSGLVRSVKLAAFEELLDNHLYNNRQIPQYLLLGKKLPVGRAAMLRNLGQLFSLRGHVNLHSELLDSPDFCWSNDRMEEAFSAISKNLDVTARISVFNKKLDYANELGEVLRNHLHEQHSLKLEWCIIILISIEILFTMIHYMERFGILDIEGMAEKWKARHRSIDEAEVQSMEDTMVESTMTDGITLYADKKHGPSNSISV